MSAYKEELLINQQPFPVEIFIADNQKSAIDSELHYHDCFELLYILKGTVKQQINEHTILARENELIILTEGDLHSTSCNNEEQVLILVVKFSSSFLEHTFSRFVESRYILAFLNNHKAKVYALLPENKAERQLIHLLMALFDEFSCKDPGFEISIKGIILQLIALLARIGIIPLFDASITEVEMSKMNQLLNYIECHYKEPITLQVGADFLNMSYSYISRYFKKVTGSNFSEYVNFVRIREAEKLILLQKMLISEAAYESGFANITSFNRTFKRMRGYIPTDIKKTNTVKK